MKILKRSTKENAITLIALVITIIVLLILAGISISMLAGENGLLSKAGQAKANTIVGQEKEQVEVAYISAAVKKLGDHVTGEELQDELDILVGENKTEVTSDGDGTLNVYYTETEHSYSVTNGEVAKIEDAPKVTDATPGELAGAGTESSPFKIESIEDLVTFSIMVNGGDENLGIASNQFENQNVSLAITLDFKSRSSYCNYETKEFDTYLGGDGNTELMTQLVTR